MGPLAVLVIACVLSQDSVFGQCTTRHCSGDDGEGGTLAATVSQLQEAVETLQQQVTRQEVHLTKQEVKLTAQEKAIAFLRNASTSLLITHRLLASFYCMGSISGYMQNRSAAGENDRMGNYIGDPEMKIGRVCDTPTHW